MAKDQGYLQAKAQYESIQALVAALDVDFDRLEELRDEKADYEGVTPWGAMYIDAAEELHELADRAGEFEAQAEVEAAIQQDPLDVQVRSGWHSPGTTPEDDPEEFEILLCTGGPAVRIRGTLDRFHEPDSARLQYQDWSTPWTEYVLSDHSDLLRYCQQFYFGE